MAKSKRKAGGATRGRMKLKKMGKGWSTMRKGRGSERPIRRTAEQRELEQQQAGHAGDHPQAD